MSKSITWIVIAILDGCLSLFIDGYTEIRYLWLLFVDRTALPAEREREKECGTPQLDVGAYTSSQPTCI